MFGRLRTRDPWWDDGTGARKTYRRVRIESFIAFSIAIVACGVMRAPAHRPAVSAAARRLT